MLQQKTIKLAHGLDTSHPVHKAMVFMGQELERNSESALKLEIYPNQQLGSERQCLELLQSSINFYSYIFTNY